MATRYHITLPDAARARDAGRAWLPSVVAPRYAEVFANARRGSSVFAGPAPNL